MILGALRILRSILKLGILIIVNAQYKPARDAGWIARRQQLRAMAAPEYVNANYERFTQLERAVAKELLIDSGMSGDARQEATALIWNGEAGIAALEALLAILKNDKYLDPELARLAIALWGTDQNWRPLSRNVCARIEARIAEQTLPDATPHLAATVRH